MKKCLLALVVAFSLAMPTSAGAAIDSRASCGWQTSPGVWSYSPSQRVSFEYVGHAVYFGSYYRRFLVTRDWVNFSYWDIYCG